MLCYEGLRSIEIMTRVWLAPDRFVALRDCKPFGTLFLQVLVGVTGMTAVECLLLRSLSRFFLCASPPTVRAHLEQQNLPAPNEPSCFFPHVSQRRSRTSGGEPARGNMRI